MKNIVRFVSYLIILFTVLCIKPVFALNIDEPKITGVEYVNDSSVKILYKTNNINSNYKVQIYNMTNGKYYSNSVTNTDYTLTGLTTGKTYNIIMRVYYKTTVSNWSDPISATPKEGVPVINSVTVGDKKLTLNYKTNGSPKEVEIYITNLKKSVKSSNLSSVTVTGLTNGTTYTFLMRNCYSNGKCSGWSTSKSGVPKATAAPVTPTPAPAPTTETKAQNAQKIIDKALAWAKKIADDNSWHYGNKKGGTVDFKKKLLNCSGFAQHAYQTGAGITITRVKNYRYNFWAYGMPTNLNNTKGFTSMGKIAKSKLKPGDILIKKNKPSSSHVEMFWGKSGSTYYTIGAHTRDSVIGKNDSISVKKMTINYTHVYRYTGT